MIEQGLVGLIQGNSQVRAIAATGGFLAELPKDCVLPSWTHKTVSQPPSASLTSFKGLTMRRWEINCYGETGADTINLAHAIDAVIDGFHGTLGDPDATYVDSCFQSDLIDFFDDARRSYRRMIEYEIWFNQI